MIDFLHSGDMGDIVASLPTVKDLCDLRHDKARIFLDATGGITDQFVLYQSRGRGLKFNQKSAEFLAPLLRVQPYVGEVIVTDNPPKADYNLNQFRKAFLDRKIAEETNQNLMELHQVAFGIDPGYRGPWLSPTSGIAVDPGSITVARSTRYQSGHVYLDARKYMLASVGQFVGTDLEHAAFEDAFQIKIRRKVVRDALEMSQVVQGSQTIIANGTLLYWVAVGLGHPRIAHEQGVDIPTTFFRDRPKYPAPPITYFWGAWPMSYRINSVQIAAPKVSSDGSRVGSCP